MYLSSLCSLQIKKTVCIASFLCFGLLIMAPTVVAQISPGTYASGYYVESRWNDTKKMYEKMQTVELESRFMMDRDGLSFKKGNSVKWLYNRWQYKGELSQTREIASDWYLDERGQKIVIDYDNKTLLYYHEYDKTRKIYLKLTTYKNLKALDTEEDGEEEESEKFRVDMEYVAVYNAKTDTWSDWKEGFNSFIINYNENGDILHIMGSGKKVIYRKLSKGVQRFKTSEGKPYQIIEVIDAGGEACSFQIFDDDKIGIKLIYKSTMIQFSK